MAYVRTYCTCQGKWVEELKPDQDNTHCRESSDRNNNNNSTNVGGKNGDADGVSSTADGPPDDIRAFYGHPLTAATTAVNDDNHASAVALLHEYINLPALDKSGMKIGDKISSIYDIMKDGEIDNKVAVEESVEEETEYIDLLHTSLASEVDKFFNRDGGETAMADMADERRTCSVSVAEEVIQDVCIETACLNDSEDVSCNSTIYNGLDQSSIPPPISTDILPINGHEIKPETYSVTILENMHNTPSTGSNNNARCTGVAPPVVEKVSSTTGSRRHRGEKLYGVEKSQELPKKLVKALTEKILKRQSQQNLQNNLQKESNELRDAVENVSRITQDDFTQVLERLSPSGGGQSEHLGSMRSDLHLEEPHTTVSQPMAMVQPGIPYQNYKQSEHDGRAAMCGDDTCNPIVIDPTNPTHPVSHTQDMLVSSQSTSGHCVPNIPPIPISKHPQFIRTNSVPVTSNQHVFPHHPMNMNNPNPATDASLHEMYYTYNNNNVNSSNSNNGGHDNHSEYVFPDPRSAGQPEGRDFMIERYLHQQNQYYQNQMAYQYQAPPHQVTKETTRNMKSPDSGFSDACVSPRDQQNQYKDCGEHCPTDSQESLTADDSTGGKVSKRRRSAPAMYVRQYWQTMEKRSKSTIAKLEQDPSGYKYFMETPISTNRRIEEDRITYLNKGQYYGLTLEHKADRPPKNHIVKSVIMAVFREDKQLEDEYKAWEFWHSRQHSHKQRVIDIDTKNSVGVSSSAIEEISYNAVAVKWNPRDSPVKVNIAIHCLSTDFSNQKGVKGLPLHIQIDTFENAKDAHPVSRAYCQIKVFCDKGAERKARDEERRKQCREKHYATSKAKGSRKRLEEVFHEPMDRSEFYPMADLQTVAVLFSPKMEGVDVNISRRASPTNVSAFDDEGSGQESFSSLRLTADSYDSPEEGFYPVTKRPRTDAYAPYNPSANILLYVREQHEVVFTAIMLRSPTLQGLLEAVEEKYKVKASQIKNTFKRSKKGILVRMDDNIIRHYSHESTFLIELKSTNEDQDHDLILTELETS